MIIVNIVPKKIELSDFNFKNNSAEFNLYFNDGVDRKISFSKPIINAEELAEQTLAEMRTISKKNNTNLAGEWDEIIVVRLEKEDETLRKLQGFFERVKERMKDVRLIRTADGYLDRIRSAKVLVTEL